jgi:hypothetical protein
MTDDAKRIAELLVGRVVRDGRGVPRTEYLKEGSVEEKEARRALARTLRWGELLDINPGARIVLAALIDPDDLGPRRIRFENRGPGAKSNSAGEQAVAEFIWAQIQVRGSRQGEEGRAKSEAEEKFKLRKSRVSEIWQRWRPALERQKGVTLKGKPVNPFRPPRR